jgi:hypothetical protein
MIEFLNRGRLDWMERFLSRVRTSPRSLAFCMYVDRCYDKRLLSSYAHLLLDKGADMASYPLPLDSFVEWMDVSLLDKLIDRGLRASKARDTLFAAAVVYNRLDLCEVLRQRGMSIVVTVPTSLRTVKDETKQWLASHSLLDDKSSKD